MPPVAVAVAAAAAASAAGGLAVGGALFSAGLLGSFGAAIVADSIFAAVVGFAVQSVGGSLVGQKSKRKSAPNLGADLQQGIKQVVRLSDDSYKLIYGKARVGGTLVYIESANNGPDSDGTMQSGDNLFLHMIIVHAGHEVTSFEELYLDDDLITLDADGFVQETKYIRDAKSYVRIKHHLGATAQTADTFLVSEVNNWTTSHRLRGLAYSYIRLQWNAEVFTSGIPTFNAVIKGKKVLETRLADIDYGSVAAVYTDSEDYGSVTDTVSDTYDYGSVAVSSSDLDVAWSDNAALIIRDFLTSRDDAHVPYGFGATDDEIDDNFTTAAANICSEDITKLDSTTFNRYSINGIVDTSAAPLDTLEHMITAMAGAVTYPKGKFRIHAGAYETPETTVVDESWLAGEIEAQFRIPRQEIFNAVRGTFINPAKSWQRDDFTALTSAVYEEQDNDERIYTDIELAYTIDNEQAQRIAKIVQRKSREQISVTLPCNYKALQFTVWDNIKVTNAIYGWSEKVFKIVGFSFDLRGGVQLQLREENSTTYDWDVDDATSLAAAPDTNLPNPFTVSVPTGVAYNSRAVDTVAGDTLYNLVLSWDEHSDAFVRQGGQFEIQFRLSADTVWRPSFFVDGLIETSDIVSSSVNVQYDLRIRAINTLGARSNWVQVDDATVGSSGGVGSTEDWGEWVSAPGSSDDFGEWVSAPGSTDDWGYYT